MDNMLFSPEENAARRKFHELFCTKYLYTGAKKGALNTDSWNANILWDILGSVYGQTILTPADIETMLQMGGMYDSSGELYFHYSEQTPMSKTILHAISPYISTNAFIRGNQELQGRVSNSVASFYHACCCNLDIELQKRYCNDVYAAYQEWCTINGMLVMSSRTFSKKMRDCGCPPKKGYMDKKCGVMYYHIRLDEKEVNKIVQQTRTPEKFQEEDEFQNDAGAGVASVTQTASRAEEKVATIKEESEIFVAGHLRNFDDDGSNDEIVTEDGSESSADESTIDEDGFDWEAGDYIPSRDKSVTGGSKGSTKELSPELKHVFKQLKITYRISPEHFSRKEFNQALEDCGIAPTDEIFEEFIKYVQ